MSIDGLDYGLSGSIGGGAKRPKKTSNCHCGLPSCICRCARDVCPKNCRCMKCRRGRKSRRRSSMKVGGFVLDPHTGGGRRRGRPCKATRRKSTRSKRTRRKRRKTLKTRY